MNQNNLPKKRGRKKKIIQEAPVAEEPLIHNEPTQNELPPTVVKKKVFSQQEQEEMKMKRAISINKLKIAAKEYNVYTSSSDFINRVQNKFMERRYRNFMCRVEGFEIKYSKIYKDLKLGIQEKSDEMEWNKTITKNAVKKVSQIIEYLLVSGPLTESESELLNKCVDLFKSYFKHRYFLFIKEIKHSLYYQNDSFVPESRSILSDLFICQKPINNAIYFIEQDDE